MIGRSSDAPVGLSPLDASWNQVKSLYITCWTDGPKQSTGALDVFCSREHVWCTSTRLLYRLIWRFRNNHRCIGCTMFQRACLSWSVNLFSTGWTDTPSEHAPVLWRKPGYCVRAPNGYYLDTERPVEPMPSLSNPSVLPTVTIFLQWTSNGYVTLSTLYKGTPWLIWTAFDALNTWGHLWEEERVHWAKEWWSRAW